MIFSGKLDYEEYEMPNKAVIDGSSEKYAMQITQR